MNEISNLSLKIIKYKNMSNKKIISKYKLKKEIDNNVNSIYKIDIFDLTDEIMTFLISIPNVITSKFINLSSSHMIFSIDNNSIIYHPKKRSFTITDYSDNSNIITYDIFCNGDISPKNIKYKWLKLIDKIYSYYIFLIKSVSNEF